MLELARAMTIFAYGSRTTSQNQKAYAYDELFHCACVCTHFEMFDARVHIFFLYAAQKKINAHFIYDKLVLMPK